MNKLLTVCDQELQLFWPQVVFSKGLLIERNALISMSDNRVQPTPPEWFQRCGESFHCLRWRRGLSKIYPYLGLLWVFQQQHYTLVWIIIYKLNHELYEKKSNFTLFVHQSRADFIAILTDNIWIHWDWLFKLFKVGSCGKFSISQSVKLAMYSSIPGHQSKPRLIGLSICCIFQVLLSGRQHSHGAYGYKNC